MRVYLILLAVLFFSACSPVTPAPQTQEPGSGYPLDTQTGIPEIDSILAAVAGGDAGELRSLVRYTTAPCTTADGLGGPPKCRDGEADGTLVDVLPVLGGEGGHIRKDEIGNWPGVKAQAVYAVYRVSEGALNEEYYPAGDFIIFFMPDENGIAAALRVAEGGIVRADTLFGEFPGAWEGFIERDASEVILAPGTR